MISICNQLLKNCPDKCSAYSRLRGGRNRIIFSSLVAVAASLVSVAAAQILSTMDRVIFLSPGQRHACCIELNNAGCRSSSCFMTKLSSLTTWTRSLGMVGRDDMARGKHKTGFLGLLVVWNCFLLFPWSPKQKYALQSSSSG